MGIIRKTASLGTMGIIPFSSPAERAIKRNKAQTKAAKQTARHTKQTRNAARVAALGSLVGAVQNQAMLAQGREEVDRQAQLTPAAWYPDPSDPRMVCWWDGVQWHPETRRWP